MAGTSGTKEIATDYPNEEGLTAGTQTQVGRQENLLPESSSKVLLRNRRGIN